MHSPIAVCCPARYRECWGRAGGDTPLIRRLLVKVHSNTSGTKNPGPSYSSPKSPPGERQSRTPSKESLAQCREHCQAYVRRMAARRLQSGSRRSGRSRTRDQRCPRRDPGRPGIATSCLRDIKGAKTQQEGLERQNLGGVEEASHRGTGLSLQQ